MAGGMNKRGSYGPMAERVAAKSRVQRESPAGATVAGDMNDVTVPDVRQCWVSDRHGRLPGLLLEWRQRPDGWHGRVVHLVRDDEGWAVVVDWLPAGLLEPG